MYPAAELIALEARKLQLRQKIAVGRLECAADAAVLARPIDLIDRTVAQVRRIAPYAKVAAVPLAILLQRRLMHRGKQKSSRAQGMMAQAFKWMPALLSAARMFASSRR